MSDPIPFDPRRRRKPAARGRTGSPWLHSDAYGRKTGRAPWRARPPWWRRLPSMLAAVPLAAFAAVLLWGVPANVGAALQAFSAPAQIAPDTESARFSYCDSSARVNCVVDGDTFWYGGAKIRVADINTPEVGQPECAEEAALGRKATVRMHALLNEGPFTLEPADRDRDRYDRLLRVVTRGGESLGAVLVREGLAEEWQGFRSGWC